MRVLACFITLFVTTFSAYAQNVISVNTTADVPVPADRIAFQINLNAEATSPQEAYTLHKKREKVLVKLLDKYNIKEENIEYDPVTINKIKRYPENETKGVRTQQRVRLSLEDFETYEEIQVTLIENNFDEFSGEFMSSESKKGENEALREALSMARDKANIIAKETGLSISGVESVDFSYNQQPPRPMMEMASMRADEKLLDYAQMVTVSATVSVKYSFLKQGSN